MGGRRWTDEEIEFLKENYAKLGTKGCAEKLGRSRQAIWVKAGRLELCIPPELRRDLLYHCQLGKLVSESTRNKLSKASKGRIPPNRIPRERLLQGLLNLAYILDRSPKSTEVHELLDITEDPFRREFGSWKQALAAAGLPPAPRIDGRYPAVPPQITVCKICGKEIVVPAWKPKHHFCSRICSYKWHSSNLVGSNNPNWRGGKLSKPQYGSTWSRQRRHARKRDNYTCQCCGITEHELGRQLDVHHIRSVRKFADPTEANDLANLVSLCRLCHRKIESKELRLNCETNSKSPES